MRERERDLYYFVKAAFRGGFIVSKGRSLKHSGREGKEGVEVVLKSRPDHVTTRVRDLCEDV